MSEHDDLRLIGGLIAELNEKLAPVQAGIGKARAERAELNTKILDVLGRLMWGYQRLQDAPVEYAWRDFDLLQLKIVEELRTLLLRKLLLEPPLQELEGASSQLLNELV